MAESSWAVQSASITFKAQISFAEDRNVASLRVYDGARPLLFDRAFHQV
jgi:hypothetical protein